MQRVKISLWFDVPDMSTAAKLQRVIADHAQHDVPADVDGQPVEYRGSDVEEETP